MLRRIVSGVALAALFAVGAHAQSPFTENFTFLAPTPANGQDFNQYSGRFNIADPTDLGAGFVTGSPFQIWCVDETHFVTPGTSTYNVWVTPLSTISDWSHVYVPIGEPGRYAEAAALSTEMSGTGVTIPNDYVQYAIWQVLGYPYPPVSPGGAYDFSDCNGANFATCDAAVTADEGIALANLSHIDLNRWLVITFDPTNCVSNCTRQEFLTLDLSRPQEFVPEPGTMAMLAMGLVGMAGAGMRRRKIKK